MLRLNRDGCFDELTTIVKEEMALSQDIKYEVNLIKAEIMSLNKEREIKSPSTFLC